MNWRNFTVFIGVALVIGGVSYSVSVPTAPMAVLYDAGLGADCTAGVIRCPVHLSDSAVARALDAGLLLARPTQRYVRAETLRYDCPDRMIIPLLAAFGVSKSGDPHLQVVQRDRCELGPCTATCAKAFPLTFIAPPCVRAPADGGVCWRSDGDGGARDFGVGNVFPVGEAVGSGCEAVECGVYAGDDPGVTL